MAVLVNKDIILISFGIFYLIIGKNGSGWSDKNWSFKANLVQKKITCFHYYGLRGA